MATGYASSPRELCPTPDILDLIEFTTARVEELLDRAIVPRTPDRPVDAHHVLSTLWDAVLHDLQHPSGRVDQERVRLLGDALADIREVETLTARSRPGDTEARYERIRAALTHLHACTTVDDLLTSAARQMCTFGFDRALVAGVSDSCWNLHYMHDEVEPRWAEDLVAQGKAAPPLLDGSIVESDAVAESRPRMVFEVQDNPRVAKSLVRIGRTESYCVAPLSIRGHVFGLIHGDCYHRRRRVTVQDQHALSMFAEGLSHSLARVTVLERAATLEGQMRSLTREIELCGGTAAPEIPGRNELSRREHDIAELVATGESNRQIARRLGITEATVKTHLTHTFRKLGIASRSELLALWLR
ncbi:LuxR C-terminal-related transcriptional regulator [Nocardia nova]|uniref:LuxR C-terminal-related transcriptional regulator n=1 Tax=Nocardia nova TaxID=37330 RepID=UPI0034044D1A